MCASAVPGLGAIPSADIAVPDHDRELRFYARVLGTGDRPLWRDDLMNRHGVAIIGLGVRVPAYDALPLQWMPHIQVADVATSVRRALARGGQALMHAKGDDGCSLWAVLRDPDGAAFGVIPIGPPGATPAAGGRAAASESLAGAGQISHVSLAVPDPAAATAFYRDVIGWDGPADGVADGRASATDPAASGAAAAPVARIHPARGPDADLPACWVVYLPVGDLAESLRRVQTDGGAVLRCKRDPTGAPASAVVTDPVGACFGLVAAP